MNNPNVNQRRQSTIDDETQVTVPNARFNCNGKVTNVAVSMKHWLSGTDYPMFQVWRPVMTSFQSNSYNKVGEVQLPGGSLKVVDKGSYVYADILLNNSSQIEFQSGDVIGYYQPFNSRLIWNTQTSGYTSYSNNVTGPLINMDINHVDNIHDNYQPLIEVMFGKILQYCYTAKCVHTL